MSSQDSADGDYYIKVKLAIGYVLLFLVKQQETYVDFTHRHLYLLL